MVREADARFAVEAGLGVLFDVDDNFLDDKNFVCSEGADHWPEDGDRGAEDSDVDFQHAEDVYDGCMVGHVEDGVGAATVLADGDHTTNGYHSDAAWC